MVKSCVPAAPMATKIAHDMDAAPKTIQPRGTRPNALVPDFKPACAKPALFMCISCIDAIGSQTS